MTYPSRPALWQRIARTTTGLGVGFAVAVPELVLAAGAGLALLGLRGWTRPRRPAVTAVTRVLRAVTGWEFRRVAAYSGRVDVAYAGDRPLAYLATRPWLGLLAGAIGFLICYGAWTVGYAVMIWATGGHIDDIPPSPGNLVYLSIASIILAFLAFQGLAGVATLERLLTVRLLGPSRERLLAERVVDLTRSRAEVVEAVDAERRRIERDLHDGVQQRSVALGMLIGRARRGADPDRRAELLRQAHKEAQLLLSELREVSWRVYPAALESDGLAAAIESVIERSPIPVRLTHEVPRPPSGNVATAAYFVVCESVTNAVKHSQAAEVVVDLVQEEQRLRITVWDDGIGGADAHGGGLSGLARRVAAVDGHFGVDSPDGGPTRVTAVLPCA